MARWQPNCTITKGFAFEDSKGKVKQYKKGREYHLSGDAKDFAALNRLAVMIKSDEPEEPKETKSFFSKADDAEGSDIAL